ncbi:MAG: hypothetical protein ACK4L4_04965 [Gemmobacter sp.]
MQKDISAGQEGHAPKVRALSAGDVLRAAALVLATALIGVMIFVLSVAAISGLGPDGMTPATLEPGLGLSNQALGVAFALAGAFASTVVAYAALKAQSTANIAQMQAETAREDLALRDARQRQYAEYRADFARHVDVIAAIRDVFSSAQQVVEEALDEVVRHLSAPQAGPVNDVTDRSTAIIIAAHQRFWDRVRRANEAATPKLALDAVWIERFTQPSRRTSRLALIAGHFGFFRQQTPTAAELSPGLLSGMGTPMTSAVASDIMLLARLATAGFAQEQLRKRVKVQAAEVAFVPPKTLAGVREDMNIAVASVGDLAARQSEVIDLSTTAHSLMDQLETLHGALEPDALSRMTAGALSPQLEDAAEALSRLAQDARDLRASLPDPGMIVMSLDQAHGQIERLFDEINESLASMTSRLEEANKQLTPRGMADLALRRHDAGRDGQVVISLVAFVAGSIVLPDGALLCAMDEEDRLWKLNLGLALLGDLTTMYVDRCNEGGAEADANPDTVRLIDMARLVGDDEVVVAARSRRRYGDDRASLIGRLPVAFDAIWQQLREHPQALLSQLAFPSHSAPLAPFQVPGMFAPGTEDTDTIARVFAGRDSAKMRLALEPVLLERASIRDENLERIGSKEDIPW